MLVLGLLLRNTYNEKKCEIVHIYITTKKMPNMYFTVLVVLLILHPKLI